MRDPVRSLAKALGGTVPIVIVVYDEHEQREGLVAEVVSLLWAGPEPVRVREVAAVDEHPHVPVLIVTADEAEAVRRLNGRRDMLIDRRWPVVLFLMRGGSGMAELAHAPGLASWVRGTTVDPDALAQIDAQAERRAFLDEAGRTPEAWLDDWRAGKLPDTLDNNLRSHRASLLERR